MLNNYYRLTKPGIIRGNAMVAAAAFIYASGSNFNLWLFVAMITGTSLVIASSCVFNNYIDRDIDRKMSRTNARELVTGKISYSHALIFATSLGVAGLLILGLFTNIQTLLVGVTGMFFYVVVYGYYKRRSVYGTIVGSISGALPPVAGYVAYTGRFDITAAILFLIMVCWQMPHFYAIAMYRYKDYKAAGLPVLPVVRGMKATRTQILLYIVAYTLCATALYVRGFAGNAYLLIMLSSGFAWLIIGIRSYGTKDDAAWARNMFFVSLIVLLMFSLALSINPWLS